MTALDNFMFEYQFQKFSNSLVVHADCFEWMGRIPANSVRASMPLGQGLILDPFMGSGSTVAAAEAQGLTCIGIERFSNYFEMAKQAVPKLARLGIENETDQLSLLDFLDI